jgi:diaminopimelate decarboxylase
VENTQLLALAHKYGSPLYVYDTDKIESQYNRLTDAFSSVKHLKLNYAVKALSNVNILKFFKNLGSGLDTVSFQEVQLCLTTGIEPHDIIYTPNGVSLDEIEAVAKLGVQINIDNLSILEQFGQNTQIFLFVCVSIHILWLVEILKFLWVISILNLGFRFIKFRI